MNRNGILDIKTSIKHNITSLVSVMLKALLLCCVVLITNLSFGADYMSLNNNYVRDYELNGQTIDLTLSNDNKSASLICKKNSNNKDLFVTFYVGGCAKKIILDYTFYFGSVGEEWTVLQFSDRPKFNGLDNHVNVSGSVGTGGLLGKSSRTLSDAIWHIDHWEVNILDDVEYVTISTKAGEAHLKKIQIENKSYGLTLQPSDPSWLGGVQVYDKTDSRELGRLNYNSSNDVKFTMKCGNTIVLTPFYPSDQCAYFDRWSDGNKDFPREFVASENLTLKGYFAQGKKKVVTNIEGNGAVEIRYEWNADVDDHTMSEYNRSGLLPCQSYKIKAMAGACSKFKEWKVDPLYENTNFSDDFDKNNETFTLKQVAPIEVTAVFEAIAGEGADLEIIDGSGAVNQTICLGESIETIIFQSSNSAITTPALAQGDDEGLSYKLGVAEGLPEMTYNKCGDYGIYVPIHTSEIDGPNNLFVDVDSWNIETDKTDNNYYLEFVIKDMDGNVVAEYGQNCGTNHQRYQVSSNFFDFDGVYKLEAKVNGGSIASCETYFSKSTGSGLTPPPTQGSRLEISGTPKKAGIIKYEISAVSKNHCFLDDEKKQIVTIQVNDTIVPVLSSNDAVCKNGNLTIKETESEANAAGYTYTWNLGEGGTVVEQTGSSVTASWSTAGIKKVSLTITNKATGCKSRISKNITVNDLPTIDCKNYSVLADENETISIPLPAVSGGTVEGWSAEDASHNPLTISDGHITGQFPIGEETQIKVTATYCTDQTKECEMTVKVIERKDPCNPILDRRIDRWRPRGK